MCYYRLWYNEIIAVEFYISHYIYIYIYIYIGSSANNAKKLLTMSNDVEKECILLHVHEVLQ